MSQAQYDGIGANRGSFKSYATGFILALVLTGIAFAFVMSGPFRQSAALFGVISAAILQIAVHLHYFLHLDRSSSARWNVMALIFTLLIMTLFVGGTMWIMYHLNYRMM
jgi:cytochrome o ubiquinol oxidase operon protein cyoD